VNTFLTNRHHTFIQLKNNLLKAQERMKKFADQKRTEQTFSIGDWVYLKLQPYRQISLSRGRYQKLGPRFYGPFEIEDRVGQVAYRLHMPSGSAIHPVIHISQLKRHISRGQNVSSTLPISGSDAQLHIFPEYILDRRAIRRNNEAVP
jgi:hypothetical protein